MLSEQAAREMREDAKSAKIREDVERIRAACRRDPSQPVNLDHVLRFLSSMHRCFPSPPPRPFVSYTRVLL